MGRGGGCYTQGRVHRPRLENLAHCRLWALTTHLLSRTKGHNCTCSTPPDVQRSNTATGYKKDSPRTVCTGGKEGRVNRREGSGKDLQKPLGTNPPKAPPTASHLAKDVQGWRANNSQQLLQPSFHCLAHPVPCRITKTCPVVPESELNLAQQNPETSTNMTEEASLTLQGVGFIQAILTSLQHPAHCWGTKQVLNNICWPRGIILPL